MTMERDVCGKKIKERELLVVLDSPNKEKNPDCFGLCSSIDPDVLYCSNHHAIFEIKISSKSVSSFAGSIDTSGNVNGSRLEARFDKPKGLLMTDDGDIYICDYNNRTIRVISNEEVSVFAGSGDTECTDGPKDLASFKSPFDIAEYDGTFYVADAFAHNIRMIDRAGYVTTLNPTTTDGDRLSFGQLANVCIGLPNSRNLSDPTLFLSSWDHTVRSINLRTLVATTLGPSPTEETSINGSAGFNWPCGVVCSYDGQLFIADNENHVIRELFEGQFLTLDGMVGQQQPLSKSTPFPTSICLTSNGDLIWSEWLGRILMIPRLCLPPQSADLAAIFNIPEFSDLIISHNASSTTFHILKDILSLHADAVDPFMLSLIVQESPLPADTVSQFLRLLYGSTDISPTSEHPNKATLIVQLISLAQALGMEKMSEGLSAELVRNLPSLDSPELELLRTYIMENARPDNAFTICSLLERASPRTGLLQSSENHGLPRTATASRRMITANETNKHNMGSLSLNELMEDKLKALASKLSLAPAPDYTLGNFSVTIEECPSSNTVVVHDWLLYAKWPYFRRMFESGMVEFQSRQVSLPSHFPPQLLLKILRFLYCGDWDATKLSSEEASFIVNEGGEFGFVDLERNARPGFERIVPRNLK
jgi:hypothetical protein